MSIRADRQKASDGIRKLLDEAPVSPASAPRHVSNPTVTEAPVHVPNPLVDEKVMDLAHNDLQVNRFSFKPLSASARRTVADRLNELDVDPIAVLAALAIGLDPRTGEPLIAVKPIKMSVYNGIDKKTGKPIVSDEIVNHEYPGATGELMAFCAKELATFIYPKLKQVEVSANLSESKTLHVVWNGPRPSWVKEPVQLEASTGGDTDAGTSE